ncbi:MAG: peptidoglycan DD-metalloendopeptidase family protein [Actinobacteria bacterium]|nr:peptidoglycan DD-metalloendopeptidase family protein [Actinomycetota bacterium]
MARRVLSILAFLLVSLLLAAPLDAAGNAHVAALQTALRKKGLYRGTIDGVVGAGTRAAVRALQRRAGLAEDGVPGPRTRRALGRYGRPALGKRVLGFGARGFDVAALQFLLAWHGFPCGPFDGNFGPRTDASLRRYQAWAGLTPDGRGGPATLRALRTPPPTSPVSLAGPVPLVVTSTFGPRGGSFHAGIDLAAETGAAVAAAREGRVVYAGWRAGGHGLLVAIAHGDGVRTLYAHLSRVDARLGDRVSAGGTVGLVGSTGHSTGPHLHFEVRVRGAAVDPCTALR